jgi:hypothetical protein
LTTGSATATPPRLPVGAYVKRGAYDSTRACFLSDRLICRSWLLMLYNSSLLCRAMTPAFSYAWKIQRKLWKPDDSPIFRTDTIYNADSMIPSCIRWH